MLTGNKGEWSEIYALFKILADGRLYAADAELNRSETLYFPILEVYRNEVQPLSPDNLHLKGEVIFKNLAVVAPARVEIHRDGKLLTALSADEFATKSAELLARLAEESMNSDGKQKLSCPDIENFMNSIGCYKLKAPAQTKADLVARMHDTFTGYQPVVGFSIKSQLGSAATLLNACGATNFTFRVVRPDVLRTAEPDDGAKLRDRLKHMADCGVRFEYLGTDSAVFEKNLQYIDSRMPELVAEALAIFYTKQTVSADCEEVLRLLEERDPLKLGSGLYAYKFRKLAAAAALGMTPATPWDGMDKASGGYIIVKRDGDVVAFHLYNRDAFECYLLSSIKFETPSTSRHRFGEFYTENGEELIKFNLQLRFK